MRGAFGQNLVFEDSIFSKSVSLPSFLNFYFLFEIWYIQTLYCTFSLSWVLYVLDVVRSVHYLHDIYDNKPTKCTNLFLRYLYYITICQHVSVRKRNFLGNQGKEI